MREREVELGRVAPLLTISDVAEFFQVKAVHTVRAMIERGECPPPDARIGGNKPRWKRSTLLAWVEGQVPDSGSGSAAQPVTGEGRDAV